MNAPAWYAISAPRNSEAEDGRVEVHIYDEIGGYGVTAKDFISELKKYKGQHIDLRINSVGGSVIEGDAIFNALRRHRGGLTVHVDGLAASMASIIAMAGDKIVMADNGFLMIHNPWSMSVGDADDLRKEADTLDKIKESMVRTYARRANISRDAVSQMMDEEKWMDAREALDLGFIDEIDEDAMAAAASITRSEAQARFDKLKNSMSRKSAKNIKAEEVAPEVEETVVSVTDAPVEAESVDTSSEDTMNAELQAKVDALQADLDAKNSAEAAQAQASEDIAKELETLKAEVERLTAESASKDEEITALLAASKSAGEQAAAIVASVGLEPVAVMQAEPELTPAQIFNNLSGAEAVEYYRNNKREIMASVY
jgi:ATP-dependent Clp endopeptidase proteolytic subunit ClpP